MNRKPPQAAERGSKRKGGKAKAVLKRQPAFRGWATSDAEEIERRRWRGRTEIASVEPLEPDLDCFGSFRTASVTGGSYDVEIRDLTGHRNSCGCRDFATNGLGTCKHIEGVLHHLKKRGRRAFAAAAKAGSPRAEVFVPGDGGSTIDVLFAAQSDDVSLNAAIGLRVEALKHGDDGALDALRAMASDHPDRIRVSRYLANWLEERQRVALRAEDRERFLAEVAAEPAAFDLVRFPLLDYQRTGVLHLAFGERALLADDMGLGKTVQAIAACELLRRHRGIGRVLVVSPASLKAEWEEQIRRFCDHSAMIVQGRRGDRLKQYCKPAFFTLANYEQILADGPDINATLAPDVVILDEAQRIKNWQTKTARAIKGLESRYAFVLTGTPLENRIEEIYSIVQFLDPGLLGPLFRFNRDYYVLDDRGRPEDYRNLDDLSRRLQPVMLRRRKEDVEGELPGRTVSNYFVSMTDEQRLRYDDYQGPASRLLKLARNRPLTKQEFERLQMLLGCMRMTCDTPYILDPDVRDCPKLVELERILGDLLADRPQRKVLIFSEWVRMLDLVRELAIEMGLDFAWHTGAVPQDRRRAEISRFRGDPGCRLLLSSESGGVGLNLQVADAVVNLDLPWNPAKLEQRIARAWRKHQSRPVSVVNLIAEDSIEHRMLFLLDQKQELADGVLDGLGDVGNIRMPSGRGAFLERMEAVMAGTKPQTPQDQAPQDQAPQDPAARLCEGLRERHGDRFLALFAPGGADEAFMAVVDASPQDVEEERRRLAEGHVAVEVMDRRTWEMLCRLETAGVLRFAGGDRGELYRSQHLDDGGAADRQRRVQELTAEADRKLRMASLLAGGDFEAEARAPAAEAMTTALRALTVGTGADDPGETAQAGELADRLFEEGTLPLHLKRSVEGALKDGSDLIAASDLLAHARG
ncbi:DEAD/DEAH box helicase [Nitratireductor sp. XY-223]|uniref:DEAD/DEAH box helicase n=1 Tax=Nitratireductor sp. XY-223 TaxID=2561926 RepID=UPI0010AAC76A|nr:DEAD/DEAH box helicase [Nitratireductor sp. XY-223]